MGPLLTFLGELGFLFPQFPFIAHSREALADRAVQMAAELLKLGFTHEQVARGGRKAHHLA